MKNTEIHALATFGTIALTIGLGAPLVYFTDSEASVHKPELGEMETIEASLAYKKPKAPVQPQKKVEEKQPEVKPEGVSHDEQKKPDEKPKKPDESR
jgi:outer membrane biosynthesis protein TonB